MSIKNKVDDEKLIEIYKQETANGPVSKQALATKMGVARTTIIDALHRLAREGRLGTGAVLPGFAIKSTSEQRDDEGNVVKSWVKQGPAGEAFAVPEGHSVKGVSALVDGQGVITAQWVKTKADELSIEAIVKIIKDGLADLPQAAPIIDAPVHPDEDLLTLWPLPDLHVGLKTWDEEVDHNWDIKIAERTICSSMDRLAASCISSGTAIVLGGGDQMHADNFESRTANSGHALDTDGRFPRILMATCRLFVHIVTLALAKHQTVIVRILQGNHDTHSSIAISYFLSAWFRDNPRVSVDTSPSLFFWHRFGKVMLMATHGHQAKPAALPGIMASVRPQDWGASVHRAIHTFHLHHAGKFLSEGGGAVVETHQAPVPKDSWHYGMGFVSGRSLQSILYHRENGEIARNRVAIF